jgi:hypothetical protein
MKSSDGTSSFNALRLPPLPLLKNLGPYDSFESIYLGIDPIFIKNYQGHGLFSAQSLRPLLVCRFFGCSET